MTAHALTRFPHRPASAGPSSDWQTTMADLTLTTRPQQFFSGLRTRLHGMLADSAVLVAQGVDYGDVRETPTWPAIRDLDKAARGLRV